MASNGHFTRSFQFSLLRTAFQQLGYIFIVELFIEYFCCMTSPAEMCGSGPWKPWSAEYCRSAKGLRIIRRRKVAALRHRNLHKLEGAHKSAYLRQALAFNAEKFGGYVTLTTPTFGKNVGGHVRTVPGKTCVKFEVRSFNRFWLISI